MIANLLQTYIAFNGYYKIRIIDKIDINFLIDKTYRVLNKTMNLPLIKTLINNGLELLLLILVPLEHLVAAIDHNPAVRPVLGLFEGWGGTLMDMQECQENQQLLHLGPGLGNAFANIHNAKAFHQ